MRETLERPVGSEIVETLHRGFEEFRLAYDKGALARHAFAPYGRSVHTLNQFLRGFQDLRGLVRERMPVRH